MIRNHCRLLLEVLEGRLVPALLGDPSYFPAGSFPQAVAVADVNEDGILDALVANYTSGQLAVLLGSGDGHFGTPRTFAVGSEPQALAVGDVNRDAHLDVLTANRGSASASVLLGI